MKVSTAYALVQDTNLYTYHGIYRAHATNTGNHLPNSLYDTFYNNNRPWPELSADTQWNREPQYLADVFYYNGAELLLTHEAITNIYTKDPIYDCPPPNATGYRYVAYTQLHQRRPTGGNLFKTFLLVTYRSTIKRLPAPTLPPTPETPSIKLTINDALFIYYTYQHNDILRNHKQLRNTLLHPLLPADYTDADIIATMDNAIRDRADDDCGIYTCNSTAQQRMPNSSDPTTRQPTSTGATTHRTQPQQETDQ